MVKFGSDACLADVTASLDFPVRLQLYLLLQWNLGLSPLLLTLPKLLLLLLLLLLSLQLLLLLLLLLLLSPLLLLRLLLLLLLLLLSPLPNAAVTAAARL